MRLQEYNTTEWLNWTAPWKKSYDIPRQCIKKQRYHFANKGLHSQRYGSSSSHVWIWELNHKEGWVPKNWCFWTVVMEKTLESPWTAKRSNQSILKEINPEYSLEGQMLNLKLQYFGHLIWRANSLGKILVLVIAYSEWCQIHDLRKRRFSFSPGARLDHSRAFV